MCFFVQTNHTRKELLFLMFKEINLRNHSSLHKLFYSLKAFIKYIKVSIMIYIKEAKMFFDSKLEHYIRLQYPGYLRKVISSYAEDSYFKEHKINEVVAEFSVIGNTCDKELNTIIRGMLENASAK